MFAKRREKLSDLLKSEEMDAAILVPGSNMFYYTGLKLKQSERLTLAIITKDGDLTFVVPQVELSKAEEISEAKVFWYTDEQGPSKALEKTRQSIGTLQLIGVEYTKMRVMEMNASEALGAARTADVSDVINRMRIYKDENEVAQMQKAVKILEDSLEATLPYIKPGVTEREMAAQLEYEMRKRGSEGTPFETIVASGPRGATPHGRAAEKEIREGELIVMDFGSLFGGYVGDICRTVAVGEISDELNEIYHIVKEAQQKAVDIIKPGVTAHEVDETARQHIKSKGYGEYFTHRTGHGLGLDAHEDPYMMQNNDLVLQPGMVFSVEPGIYLPEKGGVRIEDNIVVTKDGHLNLMSFKKDLITL